MGMNASERVWRAVAIVMCAAVPAGFYVVGDLADAFPGVLTVDTPEDGPAAGPKALAEGWERLEATTPPGATDLSSASTSRKSVVEGMTVDRAQVLRAASG